MSTRLIRYLLLSICLCFAALQPIPAAERITEQQWQEVVADEDFSYKNQTELIEQPNKQNGLFDTLLAGIYVFFSGKTGKFIIWTLFFILVGWALYKILIGDTAGLFSRRKGEALADAHDTEEDLLTVNWEQQLKKAVAGNDLRLAIRFSYMWLLQLLQEKELIHYRNDKTNHEYYQELSATQYKQPFRQLSRQYEYAWYGEASLSPEAYEDYMNTFNTVKNQLHR